jgi:hypothetical protein
MANKERVRLVVDALRSGRYEQGTGFLQTRDGKFCCLGVSCEVAMANGCPVRLDHSTGYYCAVGGGDASDVYLPTVVRDWFGFDEPNPTIATNYGDYERVTAVMANDELAWDFDRIADGFERTYLQ